MSSSVQDERFQKVHHDPRFARHSNRKSKVKIDQRFAAALQNERFQSVQGKYDKYGRRIEKKENEVAKFYRLDEEDESGNDGHESSTTQTLPSNDKEEDLGAASPENLSRLEYLNRMARGELVSASDSSESDSDDSDDDELDSVVHGDERHKEIPMGEETRRFAVLHCDWTRIRAVDLFALFQSFAPATGAVENVTIYPSDYGLEKMKEEEQYGPQGLWDDRDTTKSANEDDHEDPIEREEENEETTDRDEQGDARNDDEAYDSDDPLGVKHSVTLEDGFDPEKLRTYELQKLRYYYAIVTCDSVKTASTIFDQCDQLEYETSSNVLDLRYVPDDTTFRNSPKDSCDAVPERYKPAIFATLALQQTDVKLTWEEDDKQRLELLTRPSDWKEAQEEDFQAYLASDVSEVESESDEGNSDVISDRIKTKQERKIKQLRNRYRSMLLGSDAEEEEEEAGKKAEKDSEQAEGEMEMSFTPGARDILQAKRQKEREAKETPFERYTREKKQEKNRRVHEKRAREKEMARAQRQVLKTKGQGAKEATLLREAIQEGDASESDDMERNFDMKKILKQEKVKTFKGKRRVKEMNKLDKGALQESFAFDAADSRFSALYAKNSLFQLDPTNPKFQKTEATKAILKERRKRYSHEETTADTDETRGKKSVEPNGKRALDAMVENLKRKSKQQDQTRAKKRQKKSL